MEARCGPGTRTPIPEVLPYLFGLVLLVVGGIELIVAVWGGLSEAGLGVVLFTIAGVAFTSVTVIAVIAAVLAAFAVTMIGATIGGLIGVFASPSSSPQPTATDSDGDGTPDTVLADPPPIAVGNFLTVTGMVYPRDHDNGANVFWRLGAANEPPDQSSSVLQHGNAADGLDRPFSHLDIDDDTLFPDGCSS